jgi:mannose-6-phosphate isomerase-like protein (cupin superfamily)
MKLIQTSRPRGFFKVLTSTRETQAALMVLKPGQATSEAPENEHPRSEQWLFVISGTGRATVGRRNVGLRAGSLLLIEKGEKHRIRNSGRKPLTTLNWYAPPAYTNDGNVRKI